MAFVCPRCEKLKGFFLKSLVPAVMIGLAMYVGWLFYPKVETRWAVIEDVHARWSARDNALEISLVFDKREECRRVIVNKDLRPLVGNDVISTNPIPLSGELPSKMLEAPIGTSVLFDRAVARVPLQHDQYLLVIVAICEQEDDDDARPAASSARSTLPIERIIVMSNKAAGRFVRPGLRLPWRTE